MLLFGAETWVVTPKMERALSGFLHGAARRLTGRQAWREKDRDWYYPSHRSRSGCVALDCATVFFLFSIDVRVSVNPTSCMAPSSEG